MSEVKVIKRSFSHSDEERYFYIPVDVPDGVEKMSIVLTAEGESTLDLGLVFPNGTQNGASGGRTKSIIISENFATPGYTPCVPHKGEWQIILGVYRVKSEVTATLTVTLEFSEPRWLFGDTHVHTYNSDGACSESEILAKCEKKGFDYVFITDHNNCRAHYCNMQSESVNVLKGMELTLYAGHINLFGVKDPISRPYCATSDAELEILLGEARQNGALISLNHPDCKLCGFHLDREAVNADCVEVWNGPMRADELEAIEWWHGQLLQGKRLSAIGGSDFHRDYTVTDLIGTPTTAIYSPSRNSQDILEAIKHGHCVISSGINGAFIELTDSVTGAYVGCETELVPDSAVTVKVSRAKKGDILRVYNNNDIILDTKLPHSGDFTFSCDVKQKGFVRAELHFKYKGISKFLYHLVMGKIFPQNNPRELPQFIRCLTNPIFYS